MVKLQKVYVAFYIAKNHSFASNKIVANNYDHAMEIATEWGEFKHGNRVKEIKIEKSKGEVLCQL